MSALICGWRKTCLRCVMEKKTFVQEVKIILKHTSCVYYLACHFVIEFFDLSRQYVCEI